MVGAGIVAPPDVAKAMYKQLNEGVFAGKQPGANVQRGQGKVGPSTQPTASGRGDDDSPRWSRRAQRRGPASIEHGSDLVDADAFLGDAEMIVADGSQHGLGGHEQGGQQPARDDGRHVEVVSAHGKGD